MCESPPTALAVDPFEESGVHDDPQHCPRSESESAR